MIRLKFRSK